MSYLKSVSNRDSADILQAMAAAISMLFLTGCSIQDDSARVESAVTVFHAAYNRRDFDKIVESLPSDMQKSPAKSNLLSLLTSMSGKLGKVDSSKRATSKIVYGYEGPQYSVDFETEFGLGHGRERFLFNVNPQQIYLVGYKIDSEKLSN